MNMKKLFRNMLFMAILFFCLTAPTSGKSVEIKSNLYFSENPIKFEPPMIKIDNVVFVPIRSLVSYFDGEITQSKKDYIYKITIQNNILKFKENVKEYTFNNSPKKFNLKPIKYKTRLYVPLAQLLRNLNYNISEKNNHYYAFATENIKKEPNKAQSIKFNYIYPRLSNDINSIYLPISKIDIPLKKIIHKNKDYVDLSKFLNYLGYKISIIEKNILLKKKNDIYAFKNNSKTVKINSNNKIIEKKLSHAPVLKKKPLLSFIKFFLMT